MKTISFRNHKVFLSAVMLLLMFAVQSQVTPSDTVNHIYVIEPTVPVTAADNMTTGHHSVQYFDGLGRPKQTVQVKSSSEGKDIVTKTEYDAFGRQVKDFLPAPSSQTNGAFIADPTSAYTGYYGTGTAYDTEYYYSEKELESSPLNRVMSQAAPGDQWKQGSGHEIKFEYLVNTNADAVDYYFVKFINGYTPQLDWKGIYNEGRLYKTVTTDENGNTIEEFKNKIGQVLLKRTYEGNTTLNTYYVYDDYGNLTYVIPPLAAVDPLAVRNNANIRDGLCYQYVYDQKNRLIEKKLPGKGWEFMLYDKQDRLVAIQDSIQRENNKWLFTKYDKFGRVVYTGIVTGSRSAITTQINAAGDNNESRTSSGFTKNGLTVSYTTQAFPASFTELLSVNYYDDYSFNGAPTPPATVLNEPVITDEPETSNQNVTTKTLLTATLLRILGTDTWEKSYTYYDAKLRPLRTYKANHLNGYTQVDSEYDFRGKVLKSVTSHQRTNTAPVITVEDNYTYSPQERLLTHTQKINGGAVQRIADNQYEKLGQLERKGVGNTASLAALQQVDYAYNIRGWLTNINDVTDLTIGTDPVDLFTFKINYNDAVQTHFPAGAGVVPLHNGNIAETFWRTASDNILRGYGYKYDELNRLRNAYYQKPGAANPLPGNYDEYLVYDLNGNITTLSRFSGADTPANVQMTDHLDYTYFDNSNQLKKVTDLTNSTTGFSNGSSGTADDYTYDANGNMITDLNKGISATPITYNHLNLPVKIQWTSTKKIEYLYNAAGVKVQKKVTDGVNIQTTDYLDGFQYKNIELQFFPHAEGYVRVTNVSPTRPNIVYAFNYVYNYTDHLGNIRLTYAKDPQTGNLKVMEENHYYPFGLKHQNYTSAGLLDFQEQLDEWGVVLAPVTNNPFKYKYNGKELQDELGHGLYDYGARNYDPSIGRWMNIDPLAGKWNSYSPYNYTLNNPVNFIDPNGEDVYMYFFVKSNKEEDNSMFWNAALTHALDLLNDDNFGGDDIVRFEAIDDLGELEGKVEGIVSEFSSQYGETKEFGIWSHAGLDGPIGSKSASRNALYEKGDTRPNGEVAQSTSKQMNLSGWGMIDFNWKSDGTSRAYFMGCNTGNEGDREKSFAQSVSSLNNFNNTEVWGQPTSSYPSKYTNVRETNKKMREGNFNSQSTYLIAAPGLGLTGRWTVDKANKMKVFMNGKLMGESYQPGSTK